MLQWGRGHRPRKTLNATPFETSTFRTGFNGAEAIGLGKHCQLPDVCQADDCASMGPRPSASENAATVPVQMRGSSGFNGAEAIGLGKRVQGPDGTIHKFASMGPRPSASENRRSSTATAPAGRRFNGAEAIGLGKPDRRRAGSGPQGASMGPRPSASENWRAKMNSKQAARASMGPRPSASENDRRCGDGAHGASRFNGAEAIGLGKPATCAAPIRRASALQWGRGHRPRKTGTMEGDGNHRYSASMGPRPSASENIT